MKKKEWLNLVSKEHETYEDEFRAEYNSPKLMWDKIISKLYSNKIVKCVPYQLCPKCNGLSEQNHINVCDVCHGEKIIPMFEIKE